MRPLQNSIIATWFGCGEGIGRITGRDARGIGVFRGRGKPRPYVIWAGTEACPYGIVVIWAGTEARPYGVVVIWAGTEACPYGVVPASGGREDILNVG